MDILKRCIVLILLVTLSNGHLLDILTGAHDRIHDTVTSVLGGGHLNIQSHLEIGHHHKPSHHHRPPQKQPEQEVVYVVVDKEEDSSEKPPGPGYGNTPHTQPQSHYGSNTHQYGMNTQSHFQSGFNIFGHHEVSSGGGYGGQHGYNNQQESEHTGQNHYQNNGGFNERPDYNQPPKQENPGYGGHFGGNPNKRPQNNQGNYGGGDGIPTNDNPDYDQPPKQEKPGYGGHYGGNPNKRPQNNQGNYGGNKPTFDNPPVTNRPSGPKRPSYGGGNYNTPTEPPKDDGNLDELISSVFTSERPGSGPTTSKDDDIPLFVPLNPNEFEYDKDTNKEPPKRETGDKDTPVAAEDMDFPIDIRFQNQ